jgi:hypothetical protein
MSPARKKTTEVDLSFEGDGFLIASQTPLARISAFQPHGGVWQLRYRARPSGVRR